MNLSVLSLPYERKNFMRPPMSLFGDANLRMEIAASHWCLELWLSLLSGIYSIMSLAPNKDIGGRINVFLSYK